MINRRIKMNNIFVCTNKYTPELFTDVHLSVDDDKAQHNVRHALDESLEEVHE